MTWSTYTSKVDLGCATRIHRKKRDPESLSRIWYHDYGQNLYVAYAGAARTIRISRSSRYLASS